VEHDYTVITRSIKKKIEAASINAVTKPSEKALNSQCKILGQKYDDRLETTYIPNVA
jgi:hypothetical protein